MNIIFRDDVRIYTDSKIVHIIEHEGHGTLHQLIEPLQRYEEHKLICTYNLTQIEFIRNDYYIIHVTGHMFPIISSLKTILEEKIQIIVFLHVSPKYLELKKKECFIDYLKFLQTRYGLKCICPSNEVSKKYLAYGLNVTPVQIGFPEICLDNRNEYYHLKLSAFYNKYVSCCTSSDPRYIDLKGINEFIDLMERLNRKEDALILGFNGMYRNVRCIRLSLNDFLEVLGHSKIYIQLSKTEAYNITAIQAKRLMIPIIVSNFEGHIDCMKYKINRLFENDDINEKISSVCQENCLIKNYQDSIKRESVEQFYRSLKKLL